MDEAPATCYRHPSEQTRIACQRCERPICPQCMIPGSVGFQCPECVSRGMRETRQHELPHGGRRSADPRATSIALIVINVIVWLGMLLTGSYEGRLYDAFALMPAGQCVGGGRIFLEVTQQECGTGDLAGATWIPGVADGAFWQVITSGFSHVGLTHILFNMLVLWMLGPSIEQLLGRGRYLATYFVAMLGGSAGVMAFSEPWSSVVGASGAIYGLMGALLVLAIRHKGNVRSILVWLGINVAISFTFPSISWQGHLGGLLGGAAVAAIIAYLPKERRSLQWPLIGAVALVFVGVIVMRALQLA